MREHVCAPDRTCQCSIIGTEPNDRCPVHGWADDRRCGECGRFLNRKLAGKVMGTIYEQNDDVSIEERHDSIALTVVESSTHQGPGYGRLVFDRKHLKHVVSALQAALARQKQQGGW